MGFLKKLFGGTEDLVAEARSEMTDVQVGGAPEIDQTGDYVTLRTDAPGLEEDTLDVVRDGGTLRISARGKRGNTTTKYNEAVTLTPAGVDAADVTYDGTHIVVRVPKSALKPAG